MNQFTLFGTLGADGELRGKALSLRIVTEERVKNRDTGAYDKRATWHRVKVLGKAAEWRAEEAKKGRRVFVTGIIEYSDYEKDGRKVYCTDLIARECEITIRPPRDNAPAPTPGESWEGSTEEPWK